MSFPYPNQSPQQNELRFVEITKRATINRQKRISLSEDQIYIAFQDPQSIPPIPIYIPNQNSNQTQYGYVQFP